MTFSVQPKNKHHLNLDQVIEKVKIRKQKRIQIILFGLLGSTQKNQV